MDYQTSVDDHQTNGYSYNRLRNVESKVLKRWGQLHTQLFFFRIFDYTFDYKRREWTTKRQWTTTKRMVTVTIVYAIWKAKFYSGGVNFTLVCIFSEFSIILLTTKHQEWTSKRQWTITKRMVTVTIVYAIWIAKF